MKIVKGALICAMISSCGVINAQTQKGSDIDGEATGDMSGRSISMPDANTVAIGAVNNAGNGSDAGHVRIYEWNGSAWTQKGLDIDGEAANDKSGRSVSMPDANTVAIGAENNAGNGSNSGHVRIYEWSGSAWVQKGLDIDGEALDDFSGYSASMPDANTIAIGAPLNDGNGSEAGHVRIYEWSGGAWIQKGVDIDGEAAGDRSGHSVSMPDANTVAIGALFNDGNGSDAGHVRIYEWNASAWVQKGLDIDGEALDDFSGWAVSMPDANTIAIGARSNDGNGDFAGHVRIYEWNGSAWVQKGLDIDGEAAFDQSGYSVSMPDANTVAIGARGNDGNGSNAGHVRIYEWSGSAWVQKGVDIDGEALDDFSGRSVSMPDANTVAIGADLNDGNGNVAGHVRVYDLCLPTSGTDIQTACDSYTWIDGNTYNSSNNSATFTLTNIAGCDSIVTLDLTINYSNTGDTTAITCDSFDWYGTTYTSSGNYDHTLTNVSGCDSVVTLDLTINTADVTVTNTAPTLTANLASADYQWLDCDDNFATISGETSQSFIAAENGNYAVEVTQNGCIDTSACEAITNVGLEAMPSQNFIVYPNPTHGDVTIELGGSYFQVEVIVRNTLGQEIHRENSTSTDKIDLELGGESGFYLIEIVTGDQRALLKVTKK